MTPCVPQGHAESTAKEASTRMINVVYTALVAILWGLFALSFHQDRSRYRNCYLLFIAIVFTIFTGALLAGEYMLQTLAFLFLSRIS
jgi:flagellar biosynthesis protein FliQ